MILGGVSFCLGPDAALGSLESERLRSTGRQMLNASVFGRVEVFCIPCLVPTWRCLDDGFDQVRSGEDSCPLSWSSGIDSRLT